MTRMLDSDRLELLSRLLDELRTREPMMAILVEGDRDVAALQALKVPDPIVKINVGASLLNFCETVAREYGGFIILTDWDRKGRELATRLEALLRSTGARVDVDFRVRMRAALPYQIHDVEALDGHVARLRRAVGVKDRRPPKE
jgi:5S rRNA maturation endonuclease (ribonuclease M5)